MNFNKHLNLLGSHSFLSASSHHWINYDADKLRDRYLKHLAVLKGTELHDLAARLIKNKVNLPRSKKTLNMYVNDAIGYRMEPEQPLYYSDNCFGTTDAICFRKNLLRIHDLKTGTTPASIDQLRIYNALFCLEYDVKPNDIETELRIYQFDEILVDNPPKEDIMYIMRKIIDFDKILESMKAEVK